jgi:hypothetical protein
MNGARAAADAEKRKSPPNERSKKSTEPASAHKGKKGWGKAGGGPSKIYGPNATTPRGREIGAGGFEGLSSQMEEVQASMLLFQERSKEETERKRRKEREAERREREAIERQEKHHSDMIMMAMLARNQQMMQMCMLTCILFDLI